MLVIAHDCSIGIFSIDISIYHDNSLLCHLMDKPLHGQAKRHTQFILPQDCVNVVDIIILMALVSPEGVYKILRTYSLLSALSILVRDMGILYLLNEGRSDQHTNLCCPIFDIPTDSKFAKRSVALGS
ncbi:hypothetical protein ACJX0J_030971, partial [Zea mays]